MVVNLWITVFVQVFHKSCREWEEVVVVGLKGVWLGFGGEEGGGAGFEVGTYFMLQVINVANSFILIIINLLA